MPPRPTVPLAVRRARPADATALDALERRAFSADRLSLRQYRHHLRGDRAALWAVDGPDGELWGAAVLFFRAGSGVARLYSIAVDARARGQGLGKRLLAAVEREARRRATTRLRLEVRQDNPAAIALYEGAGYRRFGEHANYYADGMGAWRYEKTLTRDR